LIYQDAGKLLFNTLKGFAFSGLESRDLYPASLKFKAISDILQPLHLIARNPYALVQLQKKIVVKDPAPKYNGVNGKNSFEPLVKPEIAVRMLSWKMMNG